MEKLTVFLKTHQFYGEIKQTINGKTESKTKAIPSEMKEKANSLDFNKS